MNVIPKILIADSQFLITTSLKSLIESETNYIICGITDNRSALPALLKEHNPDLLITDPNMVDYESSEDMKEYLTAYSNLAILILSNQLTQSEIGLLLKAGIRNIALKTDGKEELLYSIKMALLQRKQFSEPVHEIILQSGESRTVIAGPCGLTNSELEIVKLISNGNTTKDIALKKSISVHTVMTHRKNIFRKLEINNVSELIRFAVKSGLIDYIEYNI